MGCQESNNYCRLTRRMKKEKEWAGVKMVQKI